MFFRSWAVAITNIFSTFFLFALHGHAVGQIDTQPKTWTRNVTLKSTNFCGFKPLELLKKEDKLLVFVFLGTKCPLVTAYLPTLNRLAQESYGNNVMFFGIYANPSDDLFSIAEHALAHDLGFPVLKDQQGSLATSLGIKKLPSASIVGRDGHIYYVGAIDDQHSLLGSKEKPTRNSLREAISLALLGQESVNTSITGCLIEPSRDDKLPAKEVTYEEHVAPIIQAKCQTCHRPGQIGNEFGSFLSYKDVANFAETIRERVVDRRMPPYYGIVSEKFATLANQHRLTPQEIQTIDHWVRMGAKRGDPSKAPQKVNWATNNWALGKPEYHIRMPQAAKLPLDASKLLEYQFFKVPLPFKEDRWVQAIEMKPGTPEVVHHMELHIVPKSNESYAGTNGMIKLYGASAEQERMLHGFVPGDSTDNARQYPPGFAVRIPQGHDLVFELHYTPDGKHASDQSEAGFHFSTTPPENEICTHTMRLHREQLKIPAHHPQFKATKIVYFKKDVYLTSVRGHMHKIGKSWKLEWLDNSVPESEKYLPFVSIPIWDFNWQRSMDFDKPIFVPAGQKLRMTGYWDNSHLNPVNSDPERTKKWGIQTNEEMLNTRVKFYLARKPGEPFIDGRAAYNIVEEADIFHPEQD